VKTSLLDQSQVNVMDRRKNSPKGSFHHAGGIFPEGHIATKMQAGFDQPMFPCDPHHPLRRGLFLNLVSARITLLIFLMIFYL
jgi:hypothetical protein